MIKRIYQVIQRWWPSSPPSLKTSWYALVTQRHCKRAFLTIDVPVPILSRILDGASHSASSKNTQPWHVCVVTGASLQKLRTKLCEAFDANIPANPDYLYSPSPLPDSFMNRARACGYGLFKWKGIDRHDAPARRAHDRENMTFFGAPMALIFHLPPDSERGTFLDMGMFIQSVMLGLVSNGLGSCPQYSVCAYSDIIKQHLDLQTDHILVCGMAVGYPDPNARVNGYFPDRLPVSEFTTWHSD